MFRSHLFVEKEKENVISTLYIMAKSTSRSENIWIFQSSDPEFVLIHCELLDSGIWVLNFHLFWYFSYTFLGGSGHFYELTPPHHCVGSYN